MTTETLQGNAFIQFRGPTGPVYVRPSQIVAIGATDKGGPLGSWPEPCRILYMSGGGWVMVLDTPENMERAGL